MGLISITISNTHDLSEDTFQDICNDILDQLIESTPVVTGYFQSCWTINFSDSECQITNDCEYASYVTNNNPFVETILRKHWVISFDVFYGP